MKFLGRAIIIVGILSCLHAHAARAIVCKGFVSAEEWGTMTGFATVTLVEHRNGTWSLNDLDAGMNKSEDPNHIYLDTYSFFKSEGVEADYNINEKTLTFKYKYDSGFLGGGTQKTRGDFKDCEESRK